MMKMSREKFTVFINFTLIRTLRGKARKKTELNLTK
jgi:hypothetical protein